MHAYMLMASSVPTAMMLWTASAREIRCNETLHTAHTG